MNYLSGTERLANRYRVMRHGQSKANEAGVIVSRIDSDRSGDWGLSELGQRQALEAARQCGLPADTLICSSDFSRARQTAEIMRTQLGAPEVILSEALRERCFGDLEGTPAANYAKVWQADNARDRDAGAGDVRAGNASAGNASAGNASAGNASAGDASAGHGSDAPACVGIEPATAVLDRTAGLVADLERRYSGRGILLVSHGDTLQILQAGFLRMDPAKHRQVPHLDTAEIRELRLEVPPPAADALF
jgi:probable phosphoglycerate mutase